MDDQDLAHLAGVFDAVGFISINVTKAPGYDLGYRVKPTVGVNRAQNDGNEALMGKFVEYSDTERIDFNIVEEETKDNAQDRTRLIVKDPQEIERFLEPLLPHLVATYEQALVMLKTALPMFQNDRHLEKQGFIKLVHLGNEIREGRGATSKYDAEYFKDEWSIPDEWSIA